MKFLVKSLMNFVGCRSITSGSESDTDRDSKEKERLSLWFPQKKGSSGWLQPQEEGYYISEDEVVFDFLPQDESESSSENEENLPSKSDPSQGPPF